MTITSLNVNSLVLHIDEIRVLVKELGIHILAITETELDDTIDDSLVNIDGYTIKRCGRDRNGGGVAVYLKDTLLDKFRPRSNVALLMRRI